MLAGSPGVATPIIDPSIEASPGLVAPAGSFKKPKVATLIRVPLRDGRVLVICVEVTMRGSRDGGARMTHRVR